MKAAPILITGSHRSGTTWVGKILSMSPDLAYLQEPMNPEHRRGPCRADFGVWFPYLTEKNGDAYVESMRDCLSFRYSLREACCYAHGLKPWLRIPYDFSRFGWYRLQRKRPLVKDPIALFSAEWLAEQFGMEVVVMIRHPAAFVGSLVRAEWHFPFGDLLKQEALLEEVFPIYRQEIEQYARERPSLLDQGILLWNLFHTRIRYYQQHYKNWEFVRHEDLSKDPVGGFRALCRKLNVPFTGAMLAKIRTTTEAASAEDKNLFSIRRNSVENIKTWKIRLKNEDVLQIRKRTEDCAQWFYREDDW